VYKAWHLRSPLTNLRTFPDPAVLTVVRKHTGRLKGHCRAKRPVRKGKTAIRTSRQQPPGLHRSFPAVGPSWWPVRRPTGWTAATLGDPASGPHRPGHPSVDLGIEGLGCLSMIRGSRGESISFLGRVPSSLRIKPRGHLEFSRVALFCLGPPGIGV
jgi:hypothetical protein